MKYKRYYPKGSKQVYVRSNEEFEEMVDTIGFEAAVEIDNAYIQIVPETEEEHKQLFFDSCERVLNKTRWYLDNLDIIPTFVVGKKIVFPKAKHIKRKGL